MKREEPLVFSSWFAGGTGTLRLSAGVVLCDVGAPVGDVRAPVLVELEGEFAPTTGLVPVSRADWSW